eukprot:795046-Amphidinium_carterae.1
MRSVSVVFLRITATVTPLAKPHSVKTIVIASLIFAFQGTQSKRTVSSLRIKRTEFCEWPNAMQALLGRGPAVNVSRYAEVPKILHCVAGGCSSKATLPRGEHLMPSIPEYDKHAAHNTSLDPCMTSR